MVHLPIYFQKLKELYDVEPFLTAKIDDLGRLLIPKALRTAMGLCAGAVVSIIKGPSDWEILLYKAKGNISPTSSGMEITKLSTRGIISRYKLSETEIPDVDIHGVHLELDSMGRISLPQKLRNKIGWHYINAGDVIEFYYNEATQQATLRGGMYSG